MTLISVATATQLLKTHWPDWGTAEVSLDHPIPALLQEPIVTDRPYPPGDRVMMDGIALNAQAYQGGQRRFPVVGIVAAGDAVQWIHNPQGCVEIMTGALLPPDGDLVIPYEDIQITHGVAQVMAERDRPPYEFVHRQGSDRAAGEIVLSGNEHLNGPRWGILASVGKTR
ncbi:MAG: molybdopterin molybdenumtransferase MoeA, partial [Synechocystis sp.]